MIMGRPATGRTTKMIRVPKDFDKELAESVYYDMLPKLREAARTCGDSPRYYYLRKLLEDLGVEADG
jgi:hypothetical protein